MVSKKSRGHREDNRGRDIEILDEFEFADYLMKDVLGYFQYVSVSVQSASSEDKILRLPEKVLPFTHGWFITYSPEILVEKMDKKFQFYHTRSSLIALVSIFEVALRSSAARLNEKKDDSVFRGVDPEKCGYKTLLKRAFNFVIPNKESLYSGINRGAINRLPKVCLDVDEARRLRNLFVHKRGIFEKSYEDDAIKIKGKSNLHPMYLKFRENPEQKVPVLLTPEEYISYSCSHIELLHDLHDLIQRKFHLTDSGYSYRAELPRLKPKWDEWDRIFSGGQP